MEHNTELWNTILNNGTASELWNTILNTVLWYISDRIPNNKYMKSQLSMICKMLLNYGTQYFRFNNDGQ
jgi:hypothetical protein